MNRKELVTCQCAPRCLHFKNKKDVFVCLFIFSCVYFRMKRLDLCFSTQTLVAPTTKRILRCLSATIICCFSLAVYFLHCFGRANSPPPTPALPPPPPSQSHTCFSLTLSFSPSLSFGNPNCFLSLARKEDGEGKLGLKKTSQDFF